MVQWTCPVLLESDNRRRFALACIILGVVTLIVYSNSFTAGLVYDNQALIASDPRVRAHTWNEFAMIFTRDYWWSAYPSGLYRPITTLSYWVNYTLLGGGTNVGGYHVVNFALHWLNVCLVLSLVERLTRRFAVAVIAAAIFAVHPVTTEVVTNIAGRADLLVTLAVLLGAHFHLRSITMTGGQRRRWQIALGVVAVAGVLAKENAVVLVGVIALFNWMQRPTTAAASLSERLHLRDYIPLLPMLAIAATARIIAWRNPAVHADVFVDNPIIGASWFVGFMTAWKVVGHYVALMVFPRVLSNDYSYNQIPLYGATRDALGNALAWVSLIGVIVACVFAFRVRKTIPAVTWGVMLFVLMLLPTSNIIMPIGSIMAERFLYLPLIGASMLVATALLSMNTRVAFGATAAIVVLLGVRSHARNEDWHDGFSLASSAMRAAPNSFKSQRNYAAALVSRDQSDATLDSAIAVAEHALQILTDPPLPIEHQETGVLVNLGLYYRVKGQRLGQRGQISEATKLVVKSVDMLMRARAIDAWHNNETRLAYERAGKRAEDIPVVGLDDIYLELGDSHLLLQQYDSARADARYAQRVAPDATRGYELEGTADFYARRLPDAAVAMAMAVMLDSTQTELWKNLASCFQAMRAKAPIIESNGAMEFDMNDPAGRALVARAAPALVDRFEDAGRYTEARRLQAQFMIEFKLPATAFR